MDKIERMQGIVSAYQKNGMRQKQFASSRGLKSRHTKILDQKVTLKRFIQGSIYQNRDVS